MNFALASGEESIGLCTAGASSFGLDRGAREWSAGRETRVWCGDDRSGMARDASQTEAQRGCVVRQPERARAQHSRAARASGCVAARRGARVGSGEFVLSHREICARYRAFKIATFLPSGSTALVGPRSVVQQHSERLSHCLKHRFPRLGHQS